MKLFIRSSAIGEKNPQIVASYRSGIHIADDAHGADVVVLEVPDFASLALRESEHLPRLPDDWRERFAESILQAEAGKRIEDALSVSEQIVTLREILELIVQYGTDVSTWPNDAKTRKAELDDAWHYVREIRARARAMKSLPANPASDKIWPTRIAKK